MFSNDLFALVNCLQWRKVYAYMRIENIGVASKHFFFLSWFDVCKEVCGMLETIEVPEWSLEEHHKLFLV